MKPYKDRNGREINNAYDYDDFTRWLFNQQQHIISYLTSEMLLFYLETNNTTRHHSLHDEKAISEERIITFEQKLDEIDEKILKWRKSIQISNLMNDIQNSTNKIKRMKMMQTTHYCLIKRKKPLMFNPK